MKKAAVSRVFLLALSLCAISSTISIPILEPSPFLPRLQLHRPLSRPYQSFVGLDSIRTDDLSIPFGYRQHVKKTNRAELQPQNQNLETLPTSKKYIGNKILNDVPNTKEAVLNEEPAALSLKGLEKKGSTRRDKNGNDGGKDKKNSIEGQDVKPSASLPGKNTYNSYNTFNPGQFEESSAEWQMAMLHYLLDMKKNGHKVREVSVDKPLQHLHRELTQQDSKDDSQMKFEPDGNIEFEMANSNQNVHNKEIDDSLAMLSAAIPGARGDPIICRMEPFNICYRFDESGTMHPLGDRRPVRLIRVYK